MPVSTELKASGWVSVTQVIDYFAEPTLVDWKVDTGRKEANRISRLTAKTGTRVHDLIFKDWNDGGYKLLKADNSEVKSCMEAWERFKADYKPCIEIMEHEVKNEARGVLGHIDIIANIGESKLILDIKTAGSIRQKHWLQLDGYKWLIKEDYKVAVLRLDRNIGVYEYIEDEANSISLFVQALNLYDFYTKRSYGAEGYANGSTVDASTNRETQG